MLKGELEVKKRRKEKEKYGGFWKEWEGEGQKQKGNNARKMQGGKEDCLVTVKHEVGMAL